MTTQTTQTAGSTEGTEAEAPAEGATDAETTAEETEPEGTEAGTEPEDTEPPAASANAEAARYRTRLRETEAERDRLAGMVETLQRAEVARLAGEHLAQGADLLEYGMVGLDALLGEDGNVDPDQVGLATATLLSQRPGLGKAPVAKGPTIHPHHTGSGRGRGGTTWGDVLRS